MPPGRGQKRDAPSTSMPSLPTTIITRPQHQQQQSNSSTADTTPQSSAVILKLSKACKKHLDQHSDPNNPSVRALADGTKLPELCQRDIQTLKKLLPKVEKAIRPPTKKGQTGPSAVDVAHLCDYYQSVIRGVFCPHAAHLFDQGQGGIEVLPRVYTLFRHLSTPAILSDAISKTTPSSSSSPPETTTTTSSPPVADTIGQTIGYLLGFIPDDGFLPCIVTDLVNLLVDLSVILEENLLGEDDNDSSLVDESNSGVQVAILESCLDTSGLENQEYVLDIANKDVLFCIQASCLVALQTCLEDSKRRRLDANCEYSYSAANSSDRGQHGSAVDLLFFGVGSGALLDLLASVKPVLVADAKSPLQSRCQSVALELVNQLVQDWHNDAVEPTVLLHVSILVSRSVQFYLQQRPRDSPDPNAHQILVDLMQDLLLTPPRVRGHESTEFLWWLRSAVLETLLDCIVPIHERSEKDRNSLDRIVLKTIHCILYTTASENAYCYSAIPMALSYCESKGIAPQLFGLLEDSRLSTYAVFIIRTLLLSTSRGAGVANKEFIFSVVLEAFNDEKAKADAMEIQMSPNGRGRKRTRDAEESEVKGPESPPLQIQLSPARYGRDRTGRHNQSSGREAESLQFLSSALIGFLSKARDTASKLLSRKRNHASSSPNLVSGALQLIVEFAHCGEEADETTESGCNKHTSMLEPVISLLKPLCAYIEKNTSSAISDGDIRALEAMTDAALLIHFRLKSMLDKSDRLKSACDKASIACSKLVMGVHNSSGQKPSYRVSNRCSCPTSSSVVLARSIYSNKTRGDACRCMTEPKMPKCGDGDTYILDRFFQIDCAVSFLMEMPIFSRCILYSTLKPVVDIALLGSEDDPSMMDHPAGVQLLSRLVKDIDPSCLEHGSQNDVVSASFLFAPLLLLSETYRNQSVDLLGGEDASLSNGKIQGAMQESFTEFSKSFFGPTLCSVTGRTQQSVVIDSLQMSFGRLQMLSRMLDSGSTISFQDLIRDPVWLIAYIFGDVAEIVRSKESHQLSMINNTSGIDKFLFDTMIADAMKNIALPSASSQYRLLHWRMMAESAVRCCPTHLRKQLAGVTQQNQRAGNPDFSMPSLLSWMIGCPFRDRDDVVREMTSNQLGTFLLSNNGAVLFSIFANNEEWDVFMEHDTQWVAESNDSSLRSKRWIRAIESVTTKFFKELDRHLLDNSCFSDSQLSFTMNTGNSNGSTPLDRSMMQRSTARALASLCTVANVDRLMGANVFEKAFIRISRIWASSSSDSELPHCKFEDMPHTTSGRAVSFASLSRLSESAALRDKLGDCLTERVICGVFSDILILTKSERNDRRYTLLESFLRSFIGILAQPSHKSNKIEIQSTIDFVEELLPAIVAQFVVEEDYELLLATTGFREYLLAKREVVMNKKSPSEQQVGGPNKPSHEYDAAHTLQKQKSLDVKTKDLCLEPTLMERIIPLVFIHSEKSALIFFKRDVLKGFSLQEMILGAEKRILKGFIWEMGRNPGISASIIRGIRTAALAKMQDSKATTVEESSTKDSNKGKGALAASQWVTSHFMYLLVNAVQVKWASRSLYERIQAVQCLIGALDLLLPSESAQYFPQILATVSAAMSQKQGPPDSSLLSNQGSKEPRLPLLAVEALSKFVRIVAQDSWESVAQNLTTIVVCLVPIFEDIPGVTESSLGHSAILLLEFLVKGDLGTKLAPHFKEIPFLPPSPALDEVRAALRANKVDFDDLVVHSTGTQLQLHSDPREESLTADVDNSSLTTSGNSHSEGSKVALQKRLSTVCDLLDSENAGVRRAVLQHLTLILRANRQLFQDLIKNEGTKTTKAYLTEFHDRSHAASPSVSTRSITDILEKLMDSCIHEVDPQARVLLATCLGEIGAISELHLGELTLSSKVNEATEHSFYSWRLAQAPWHSAQNRYELELVTKHLVSALKAAASSTDQHKIAFSIQLILQSLHKSSISTDDGAVGASTEMSQWLTLNLKKANVFEIVEPFWTSKFRLNTDGFKCKEPPFFRVSPTYYFWLSQICRWMIVRSNESISKSKQSPWGKFLDSCHTAVRTQAGLHVAEFIFPLLVLNRISYGTAVEIRSIRREIIDLLEFNSTLSESMSQTERQKAVNTVFVLIETLSHWAEREEEEKSKLNSRKSSTSRSGRRKSETIDLTGSKTDVASWDSGKCIERIAQVIGEIPLSLQAKAAAAVDMHARALRLIEMDSRLQVVDKVFGIDASTLRYPFDLEKIDQSMLKDTLGKLCDPETLGALNVETKIASPHSKVRESIRQHEADGEWEAALQDYESAMQLDSGLVKAGNWALRKGSLRCLTEIGHLDSVLNQVKGIFKTPQDEAVGVAALGVEAAWRLGRWDDLSELVNHTKKNEHYGRLKSDGDENFGIAFGDAILGLKRRDPDSVISSVKSARDAVMQSLAGAARESYSRSYPDLVKLHCLREIENANEYFSADGNDTKEEDLSFGARFEMDDSSSWKGRLDLASPKGMGAIINTRIALARIANDHGAEGRLFLELGRRSRKNGQFSMAANYFSQAEAVAKRMIVPAGDPDKHRQSLRNISALVYPLTIQVAKLKHAVGDSSAALRLLGQEGVQQVHERMMPLVRADGDNTELLKLATQFEVGQTKHVTGSSAAVEDDSDALVMRFVGRLLKLTHWNVQGGLHAGAETKARFRTILKLAPDWEKGHFAFAKYIDSTMESRIKALATAKNYFGKDEDLIKTEIISQDTACQNYIHQAIMQYASALKVGSKHVYEALPRLLSLWFDFTLIGKDQNEMSGLPPGVSESLATFQSDTNNKLAGNLKTIPPSSYYTAIPQLISRIIHSDEDTATIVFNILKRVLQKYPHQAMWPLAWLRNSRSRERKDIGEKLFTEAIMHLKKHKKKPGYRVLSASDDLFDYIKRLAEFTKISGSTAQIKPPDLPIELIEFVPPIQAALSPSTLLSFTPGSRHEFWMRGVPRMRAFSTNVNVMTSKAKPKRLKAFAVPGSYRLKRGEKSSSKDDIGEIHFLVKQEAKGDLRKDARVQDLNNVINRLMSSSSEVSSSRRQRRMQLRTFAVSCLSEDVGILEWVPNTDSMRNLVSKSYNPQAHAISPKRRGHTLSHFDTTFKNAYEKCQDNYFKKGQLSDAATMFHELLKKHPPTLFWWFVQNYHDPHAWYEARTRFTLSAAIWSAVGHVIGLGDRHSENILVDKTSGDCVHVDFDCIFDKGLHLPRPEVVPFRLTQNMIDAFGPSGADGIYKASLQTAMRILRDNRDLLLSVLEPFLKDPVIDWKRHRSQQRNGSSDAAKRSILVIDERLRGIYNLRNPNLKKFRRTDGWAMDQDDETTNILPVSVEGQVHKMIAEATSYENLVQLYMGWMPWV